MARWILSCPHCDAEFTHSQILAIPNPFEFVIKPEFPDGGVNVACPDCTIATVYQRHELIYRAS
jgi:hypothetical protein